MINNKTDNFNTYDFGAEFYDLTIPKAEDSPDIKFYLDLAGNSNIKILDIGCGTGRIGIPLAKAGHNVLGFDLSKAMLDVYKRKLKPLSNIAQNISLMQASMTSFSVDEKFDMIFFPFRVFQALSCNEDRVNCLKRVKLACHEKTKIVIDMFNPDLATLNKFSSIEQKSEIKKMQNSDSVFRITHGENHNPNEQTITLSYEYFIIKESTPISTKQVDRLKLGYLFKDQAMELFESSGFEIINLYSGWDKKPYIESEKKELIFVLKLKHPTKF